MEVFSRRIILESEGTTLLDVESYFEKKMCIISDMISGSIQVLKSGEYKIKVGDPRKIDLGDEG